MTRDYYKVFSEQTFNWTHGYTKKNLGLCVFMKRISKFGLTKPLIICTAMPPRWESASLLSLQTIFPSHLSIIIWICTLLLEIFFGFLSSTILKFPRHHNIPTLIRPCFDFRHYPPDFALQTFLSAAAISQRDLSTPASSLPVSFDAVATSLQGKIIMFSAILKLLISAKHIELTCIIFLQMHHFQWS